MKRFLDFMLVAMFTLFLFAPQGFAQEPPPVMPPAPPPATKADADAALALLDVPGTKAILADNAFGEEIAAATKRQKIINDVFLAMELDKKLKNGTSIEQMTLTFFYECQWQTATGIVDANAAGKKAKDIFKEANYEAFLGDAAYEDSDWAGAVAHYKKALEHSLACQCDYG